MPGSWMSIRIRSGWSARANVSPASASIAGITVCPADSRMNVANFMFATLSSTIRILAISDDHIAARHGPPDFGRKAVCVELALLHDRRDIATQPAAILGGDGLCGDNQHGYVTRGWIMAERLNHVEAAHLRHHQIDHHQVRPLSTREFDRLGTAIRAQDCTGPFLHADSEQLHRIGIVIDHENFECLAVRDRNQTKLDERLVQLLPGYRLLHDRRLAERESPARIRHDRYDHDR